MLEQSKLEELRNLLKQEFSDYYEKSGGKNYRFYHLKSTRKHVKKIMSYEFLENKEFDEEVVEVAALFHDIGRREDIEDGEMDPFEGHEGHAEAGAEIVGEFVDDFMNEKQVDKIEKIVGNHHSEPETVEGKIIQDADLLTNYGVSDLWRMIHYSSEEERTMQDAFEYFWDTHVPRYLNKLDEFHFKASRRWARKRMNEHQKTLNSMESEFHAEDR